jgi:hypothetical protein
LHEAEEGGFWAEVPAIPGCATQGETMEDLLRNVQERSKVACPSTSQSLSRMPKGGWWKSPNEGAVRMGIRPADRAARLAIVADQRQ